jgi:hypothetical protein
MRRLEQSDRRQAALPGLLHAVVRFVAMPAGGGA